MNKWLKYLLVCVRVLCLTGTGMATLMFGAGLTCLILFSSAVGGLLLELAFFVIGAAYFIWMVLDKIEVRYSEGGK